MKCYKILQIEYIEENKRKKKYLKTTLDGKQSEHLELFTSGKKKKVVPNEFNDHVVL